MIDTRDSFLHFLADNLTPTTVNGQTVTIPVKNIRRDLNIPDAENLSMNSVNIKFLNANYDMYVSKLTVSIDVLYYDELQAAAVTESLFNLLKQAAYTPKLNYDNNTVTDTGYVVFWEPSIKFKPIHDELYYHYNAMLVLNQHQQ